MAVYIDQVNLPYGRMTMNHMMADTREELLAMADKVGVSRRWIQYPSTYREHFDVCLSKKALALQLGAIEIGNSEMGRFILKKKKI